MGPPAAASISSSSSRDQVTQATAPLTITADNFMAEVVTASAQLPMLVDFWAPWCAPCRQLMPILDRLAQEYTGRFRLAKVNTDEQQDLASQIGIRSLPTVVLFKDGTAVDHFMGVVPEAQIRQMLDKHLPKLEDEPVTQVQSLKAVGDLTAARTALQQALARDPDNIALLTEQAELAALDGELDEAREQLNRLQTLEPNHPAVKRLAALLVFSNVIAAYPDVRGLKERVNANPQDLDLRHALAVHQLLGGQVEPALATWLDLMRNHRSYKEDLARKSLVQAFELIGAGDPIVAQTRKEMARMLF